MTTVACHTSSWPKGQKPGFNLISHSPLLSLFVLKFWMLCWESFVNCLIRLFLNSSRFRSNSSYKVITTHHRLASAAVKKQSLSYWRYTHTKLNLISDLFCLAKQDDQPMLKQEKILKAFWNNSKYSHHTLSKIWTFNLHLHLTLFL